MCTFFSRQMYSYNYHICKLNDLKVIDNLYFQYLIQSEFHFDLKLSYPYGFQIILPEPSCSHANGFRYCCFVWLASMICATKEILYA